MHAIPLIFVSKLTVVATQCCKALMTSAVKGQVALQKGLNQLVPELVKALGAIVRDADNVQAGDVMYVTAEEIIRLLLALVEQTTDTSSKSDIDHDPETALTRNYSRNANLHDTATDPDSTAGSREPIADSLTRHQPFAEFGNTVSDFLQRCHYEFE